MLLPLTSKIPSDMPNHDLALGSIQFMEAVRQLDQFGLGHVMTGLSQSVIHSNPAVRAMIQGNVDEIIQGFTVIYYFSVWESCFTAADTKKILKHWATSDEVERFQALRHVRHSLAHSFNGKRARQDRVPFEAIMQSSGAFKGLEWDRNSDTIYLAKSQISHDCRQFFQVMSISLAGRLLNPALFQKNSTN